MYLGKINLQVPTTYPSIHLIPSIHLYTYRAVHIYKKSTELSTPVSPPPPLHQDPILHLPHHQEDEVFALRAS